MLYGVLIRQHHVLTIWLQLRFKKSRHHRRLWSGLLLATRVSFKGATNTAYIGHILKHYCCCYKSCITKEKLITKVAAIKMADAAWGTAGFVFDSSCSIYRSTRRKATESFFSHFFFFPASSCSPAPSPLRWHLIYTLTPALLQRWLSRSLGLYRILRPTHPITTYTPRRLASSAFSL
jgi:hypothetical protein